MKAGLFCYLAWGVGLAFGVESGGFFAMDTIARGKAGTVVPMLKELGYSGLGGAAGEGVMAVALEGEGLKFYNGYLTLNFAAERPGLDDRLKGKIDGMAGHGAALWLAVGKVEIGGKAVGNSAVEGDAVVVAKVGEIAEYAEGKGVRVALYPHAGLWLERVEDGVRVAGKVGRDSVGMTFNLCHWLKVEGGERDVVEVLKVAMPKLMFVTINGADGGETKAMGWDRLIQPLGSGSYDVGAFLKKLEGVGYVGPVGFQGYGIRGEPREILGRTMEAWKKLRVGVRTSVPSAEGKE